MKSGGNREVQEQFPGEEQEHRPQQKSEKDDGSEWSIQLVRECI